ncbi:hypothetical protein JHK87_028823 [Glycine soja]|nr:hypothetical protein JHK87_028823 [Glycine soja]
MMSRFMNAPSSPGLSPLFGVGHKRAREDDTGAGASVGLGVVQPPPPLPHLPASAVAGSGSGSVVTGFAPTVMQGTRFQDSSDFLRDYWGYSQLLRSTGEFHGLDHWFFDSQMAAFQSSLPSSLLPSPPPPAFPPSSASYPLFSSSQQMGIFRPPGEQGHGGEDGGSGSGFTELLPSTWSDTSGYPPPPPG